MDVDKFLKDKGLEADCIVESDIDAEDYVQYKVKDLIEEALKEQLRLSNLVEQSEQLTCPQCGSTNILHPDEDNDAQCIECAYIWAV